MLLDMKFRSEFVSYTPHLPDVPTAVRLVHQPGGSDRPTADWAALLFPTKGAFTVISLLQV